MGFFDFFTDPILRAPTLGTLFMCIASSLMGVIVLLKRKALLTEPLSHATYPGVVLGAVCSFSFFSQLMIVPVFLGAAFTSYLALKTIEWLEKKQKLHPDVALTFTLALFFGIGILLASATQSSFPKAHQSIQMFLFGQAATMTDSHIYLYAFLACFVAFFLFLSFRPLQALLFDAPFAESLGLRVKFFEKAVFGLLLFSLIIGIRSVGVILMSGMALGPAIAARQFSDRLKVIFFLAAIFGALSGLLGNILSVQISLHFAASGKNFSLPTGPMIVLVGTFFALFSLLLAPKKGLLFRVFRMAHFRLKRVEENILKGFWENKKFSFSEVAAKHQMAKSFLFYVLLRLKKGGWVEKEKGIYTLSQEGFFKTKAIVRLHRLWELYLTKELGKEISDVHKSAEEMEHILTEEMEEKLTKILKDPKLDPHHQPIPEKGDR